MKETPLNEFSTNVVRHKISHLFPDYFDLKILGENNPRKISEKNFRISVKFISNSKTLHAFSSPCLSIEEAIVSIIKNVPFEIKIAELFTTNDPKNLTRYLEQQLKNRMIFERAESMDKDFYDFKETALLNIAHNSSSTVEALKKVNDIEIHAERRYDLSQ